MTDPWRGNTSIEITSSVNILPKMIDSFTIVNKTTGSIGVNVYLFSTDPAYQVCIAPNPIELDTKEIYTDIVPRVMLVTEQLKVIPSGSIDYDFEISNIEAT